MANAVAAGPIPPPALMPTLLRPYTMPPNAGMDSNTDTMSNRW